MNVGFIGLGHMGRAMAVTNLGKAGHDIRAWNRTRDATVDLASKGLSFVSTPDEAFAGYLNSRRRFGDPTEPFEAAIELTYLAQIASWLAVQPDFQYVIHPNAHAMVPNGRAFQLRLK
jgi:NAD binding domain of 6-phosphogluconate dehydrogenase/Carbohydrate-selective porin, OprB family